MKTSISAVVAMLVATAAMSVGIAQGRGPELLVVGPVESIDALNRTAIVLGQHVQTNAAGVLVVGDSVAVFGTPNRDGSIRASAIQSRGLYVPGPTSIFIAGTVERAEPSVGRIVVNGVKVDLTSVMSRGVLAPALGSKLAISGTQPVSHGLVLVDGIAGTGASVNGIAGTGAKVSGIAGTGASVNGIAGTGAKVSGIAGTGAKVSGIAGP